MICFSLGRVRFQVLFSSTYQKITVKRIQDSINVAKYLKSSDN